MIRWLLKLLKLATISIFLCLFLESAGQAQLVISKIAFGRDNEIYVMNVDGTDLTRLTVNTAIDSDPKWSPDARRIAFWSNRDGNDEIYVMNADGTNPVNLTKNSALDAKPSWSPDGAKIAFRSKRDGNDEIHVMNADGTDPVNLTKNPTAVDDAPSWSPDGKKIVFHSFRDGNNNFEIYVMNADGTNPVNLTKNSADDTYPSWSPDGAKIAFWSNRDGNIEIYVMNADGTNPINLTKNPAAGDGAPSWSPDSRKIAFWSNRDGNDEIYAMNADGTNQTRLTDDTLSDTWPSWSPFFPLVLPPITVDPKSFVGVWLFDEGTGSEVKDFTGKGHNGKITGAKWVNGKFGKALEFDGQSSVSVPDAADLQIGEKLTMLAWFFAKDINDFRHIIVKNDEYLLRINSPAEANRMSAFVKAEGSWEPRATASVPTLATWIHLAAVYDITLPSDQLKIYVNGGLAGSISRPGKVTKTANPLEFGSLFVGIIDEVAVLNVALTDIQIKSAMSGLGRIISSATPVVQVSPPPSVQVSPTTVSAGADLIALGWSAVNDISRNNVSSVDPAIAVGASGNLHVVWREADGNGDIFYSGWDGTSWSPPRNISNTLAVSANPAIAVDASGNPHVVWEEAWGDNIFGPKEILYSQRIVTPIGTPIGTVWSDPRNISSNEGSSIHPAIAVDASGNLHVVWMDNSQGSSVEILYRQKKMGNIWSDYFNISNNNGESGFPAIAVDASENLHVVWMDNSQGGNFEILYRQKKMSTEINTGWSDPPYFNISNNTGNSSVPAIAVDKHGNLHVVWEDKTIDNIINPDGRSHILYRQMIGTSWSTLISDISNISISESIGSWDPAIAVDASGNPHVVWSNRSLADDWEIFYRWKVGTSWSTPISNISNSSGNSWDPAIAVDASGNPHVVWRDDTAGNSKILEFLWVIILVDTKLEATAGQAKLFKVKAINLTDVKISYKVGGEPFFTSLPMFDDGAHSDGGSNDGIWAREIPRRFITLKGLSVYFTATDSKGNIANIIPSLDETTIIPIISITKTNNVEVTGNATSPPIPVWNSPADWTMISFPVSLPNRISTAVFGGLGIAGTKWKAYQYNGGADYDTTFSIASGRAAWIWHDGKLPDGAVGAKTVTVTGAKAMDPTKVSAILIKRGWNQIGNPFLFNIPWNNMVKFLTTGRDADAVDILTAAANNKIANPPIIYLKSGTGYTRISAEATPSPGTVSGVLEPWKGYWFLAKTDGFLFIDPNQAIPDPLELPANPILIAPAYEPIAYKGWMLELNANGLAINAGMSQDAADALDRLDLISPPPPANDIRFAFAHPEWNDKWAVYYDQDIRAMSQDSAIWEIDLKSDDKPVTITWKQLYDVPNEYMLMLIDLTTGANVDMRKETSYTITGEGERKLYFVASIGGKGIPEFLAKLIIKKTELMQNYPNPFNPETWIPYKLANEAEVSIRIFNVSGRLVRTLNLGRKNIGLYMSKERAAYWDGRNEYGERVSSGIYFYQLQAGKVSFVRKMVILK